MSRKESEAGLINDICLQTCVRERGRERSGEESRSLFICFLLPSIYLIDEMDAVTASALIRPEHDGVRNAVTEIREIFEVRVEHFDVRTRARHRGLIFDFILDHKLIVF